MPALNYVIYGCSSSRTTQGVITIQELHTGGKTLFQLLVINLKLPIKRHPSSRSLFFSDIVLVSNYHDCKGEAIKLIPYYMIDIIYKTVKPSRLKKLQIIQNIKNQAIFIFSKPSSYFLVEF